MKVKLIKTEEFYPTMVEWWKGHNFPVVSPSILPNTSLVCYNDEDEETYSLCIYNTDSNLCWVGWEISNPNLSKESKEGCLSFLFKKAEEYAKYLGYQVIFTTSVNDSIEKVLLENNYFTKGDRNTNHYLKEL